MRRRRDLTFPEWREHLRRWLAARNVEVPSPALQSRIKGRLRTYITLAGIGSTWHARAILIYYASSYLLCNRPAPSGSPLTAYLQHALDRYNHDPNRAHRRLERALHLLNRRGGVERRSRRADPGLTEDRRIEAQMLFAEIYAPRKQTRGPDAARAAAIAQLARMFGVTPRTIRTAVSNRSGDGSSASALKKQPKRTKPSKPPI